MNGRLRVIRAGPGETIQDAGRYGYLRYGIVASGPMDWIAFSVANRALGNPEDAASIEISLAGIEIVCEDAPLLIAFAGGGFVWERDGSRLPPAAAIALRPGEHVQARAGAWGTWTYLAVAGGIDVPQVLGSRSTYARFAIGGFEGRALRPDDVVCARDRINEGVAVVEGTLRTSLLERSSAPIRVVLGPQDDYFTSSARDTFFSERYAISGRFDRMGYWLEGPKLGHQAGFDIVSDGIPLGAIQVPGSGQPVILMADHQATGGYPKLGTLTRADVGRFAQHRPGEYVRFTPCAVDAAHRALRDSYAALDQTSVLASDRILGSSNLISGVVDGYGS
ncbi:MAG TPA: biotin-dependent carboxyltransferase family protein [Candidatus Acidoferrales bacterium]|nr:biotin-dependent carboxyltransferase family protein [Candidatus Acidoferrales bacterium]